MSPRSRDAYLADRERDAIVTRAQALHRHFRTHITSEVGQTLEWIRAIRLKVTATAFPGRRAQ